jgi:pseudouridylate synthase
MKKNPQIPMDYSQAVKEALEHNKPIVALESTIITHGMDYPANVETALEVEKVILDMGAVPATIAII